MAVVIEAIDANGVVTRTPADGTGTTTVTAEPGTRYRLVDDSGRSIGAGPRVVQLDNDLIVDNLPGAEKVVLDDFFANCTSDAPCGLSLEEIGGGLDSMITPSSEPVAALTEGGYLMNTTSGTASVLPQEPGTELNWKPIAAGVGGLLILAGVAGGGGGGGGGDTTAPVDPTLDTTAVGSGTPILKGTAEAGSTVSVQINIGGSGSLVNYSTQTDQSGNWEIDLAAATPTSGSLPANGLPVGSVSPIGLQAVDGSGNLSAVVTGAVTHDNTPPNALASITDATDNTAPVTGSLNSGDTTDDTSPVVNGTLSAALATGEIVEVLRDGAVVGTASVTGLTWTFADTGLASGNYSYTAQTVDAAGNATAPSSGFSLVVDTNGPSAQPVITEITDDLAPVIGVVASGGLTNDGTPQLNGTLSAALGAGESLNVLRDDVVIGQATVTGTTWTFQEAALVDGTYVYTTQAVDTAGNTGPASTAYSVVIDSTNPNSAATIVNATDDVAPLIAPLTNADSTNDDAPQLNGTLNAALAAGDVVEVLRDGVVVGPATVTGSNWVYQDNGLADGTYAYTAQVVDAAGNASAASGVFQLVIDTAPPAAAVAITSATDNLAPVTGVLASTDSTNDTTPRLNGTLSVALAANEVVEVSRDGVVVGEGVVNAAGTAWTYTETPALTAGTYDYSAQVVDAAGNASAASAVFEITVDLTPPISLATITSATDNLAPVTGALATGDSTNDTTPRINGTLSAPPGANDTVQVLRDGVVIGVANVNAAGTAWNYTDTPALAAGTYDYTAQVIDAAGNPSAPSNVFEIIVDLALPTALATITNATDNVAPVTGALASTDSTNDTTPRLNGSLSAALAANEVVEVSRDGVVVGEGVVNAAGTAWTYTETPALTAGTYDYSAQVVDAIGNASAASAVFEITVDLTAPVSLATITSATDNVVPITGALASTDSTNDTTPRLNGTLSVALAANEVVEVSRDGVVVGEGVVNAAGTAWTYTETPALTAGTYDYSAQVVDAAGNASAASAVFEITVDVLAPVAVPEVTAIIDDVAPTAGTVPNGGLTDDFAPDIEGTITAALAAGETLQLLRDNVVIGDSDTTVTVTGLTWTFADSGLVDGTDYDYSARVIDAAGNVTTSTLDYTITADVAAGLSQVTTAGSALLTSNDLFAQTDSATTNSGTSNLSDSIASLGALGFDPSNSNLL